MAEDLLEDALLTKLPVLIPNANEQEVKRSEVYCSKIIHQKASHQSRFTWTPLYRKLMAHNGFDVDKDTKAPFPRPLKSPFPCFNCHMRFDAPPVFIPIIVLNGNRTEWGNFCDPSCGMTYLHSNMNDSNLPARVADYVEYLQDVHGFTGDRVNFAPHFRMLATYGGDLDEEKFRVISHTPGLRTFERMAPFIPTEVVIEWQCRIDDVEEAPPEAAEPGSVGVAAAQAPPPPPPRVAFGDRRPDEKRRTTSETLAKLIGHKPEAANHHHQWENYGLRQPPLAAIEKRLLSLPKPEEKEGLYKLYWERHGQGAPLPDEDGESVKHTAVVATPSRAKHPKTAATADDAAGAAATKHLVA